MLKTLFEKGYLDYKNIILDNIKSLGLAPNEALVLIKIMDNYPTSKAISIPSLLNSLTINQKTIEEILASLMERKFYDLFVSYNNGIGEEYISLDPFFVKIENIFNNTLAKGDSNNEIYLANKVVAEGFGRILTANELEILTSLISDENYTTEDIKNALKEIEVNKRNLNMKSLVSYLSKGRKPQEKKDVKAKSPLLNDFLSRMK